MKKRIRRTLAAMLSLALLFCASPLSYAEDGNTLTVNLAATEEYRDDIVTASVQADLYLITPAKKDADYDTYNFDPFGTDGYGTEFTGLQEAFDTALIPDPENPNDGAANAAKFSPLAESFAAIILAEDYERAPLRSVPADGAAEIVVEGLPDGLYLLVLHGDFEDKTGENGYVTTVTRDGETRTVTRAHSAEYEYLFEPQLVTLPSKVNEEGEQQYNTAYGFWTNSLRVNVKADREKRIGNLTVVKDLEEYLDQSADTEYMEPAFFVIDIIGRASEDESAEIIYRRQIAFSFDGPGSKSETLEGFLVGTWVWAEEIYTGAHYSLSESSRVPVQIVAAPSSENTDGESAGAVLTLVFTNTDNDVHRGGHGIENTFTYQAAEDDGGEQSGTWTGGWTTEPAAAGTGGKV